MNTAFSIALAAAALLFTTSAHAQSGLASAAAAASGCAAESNQPPCLSVATAPKLELPAEGWRGDLSGTFTLLGNLKGFALSQTDIARTTASFGSTWRIKTGLFYEAPSGVQFSASAIARRGYSLPIATVQPLGSDVQLPESGNASLESGAAPIHWDTELRIRKTLISSDALDLSVVGEAFNLLNLNGSAEPTKETPALTAPTIRAGGLLEF